MYNEFFIGAEVHSITGEIGGLSDLSNPAYLFYKTNPQSSVTSLTPTITNTTAQFRWNEPDPNQTTRFLFGVYDSDSNQLANQTTNATRANFDLPSRADDICQWLEFRMTAVEVQHPECPDIGQTNYSAYIYTGPDLSPVTAEFYNNQTVLVSWTPGDGHAIRIIITDLDNGHDIEVTDEDDPPFNYTLKTCGQYNLKVSVSPDQCPDNPDFTHSDIISFTIPCPTTEATETEPADQTSGALTNYPSLLLTVAAVIPLLKYFPKPY